jgi:hypothetical protein
MSFIMHKSIKVAAIGVVAAAMAACSSGGGSSTIPMPMSHDPGLQSVTLGRGTMQDAGIDPNKAHVMRTLNSAGFAGPFSKADNLTYHGGPVQVKATIYVVYWGFGKSGYDPTHEKAYLDKFYKGLGGSAWLETVHQYYQITGKRKVHIINKAGELADTWVDDSTVPTAPTDAQIQAEAQRLMEHFKFVKDGSYVVATPHAHNSSGFGTEFCGYHEDFSSPKGIISYTNLPYMSDAGGNCGENIVNKGKKGINDGASIVAGHELAESQTDPQPFSGWVGPLSEIGDACAWMDLVDTKLTTGTFATQPLWSNAKGACEQHTP